MELKINIDTQAVAQQMVHCMVQNLHNSVVSFAHQKFGALNPQAGPMPFPSHFPFPGAWPLPHIGFGQPQLGGFVPQGHPYERFGVPPAPYVPPGQYFPESAFIRAQREGGNPNFPIQEPRKTEYGRLMDDLASNPDLINKIEQIITTHLQEFVNQSPSIQKASPRQ